MEEYNKKREVFISDCDNIKYAGMKFSEEEEKANKIFTEQILEFKSKQPLDFFLLYSLKYKNQINSSPIYDTLLQLPKGVLHHLHYDAANDLDWFFKEIAYDPRVFYNTETKKFKYFKEEKDAEENFKMLKKLKDESADGEKFEHEMKERLYTTEKEATDLNLDTWANFDDKIMAMWELIFFQEFFAKYLKRVCEIYVSQGIYRIEARGFLHSIFDENRKSLEIDEEVAVYQGVIDEIRKTEPLFSYALIVQGLKMWDNKQIDEYLESTIQCAAKYPKFIIGFDLVQEEDKWRFLKDYAPVLIKKEEYEKKYGVELPFIFHAGESAKYGGNTNLYDILCLGTHRIGHGLNLVKHAGLMEQIKNNKTCIELCPISNQILKFELDLRNHPARTFLNYGIKITISPDDPGFFGITGVTYDYFMLAIAQEFDLKDFKLCTFNSIDYSLADKEHKESLFKNWEANWKTFISNFLKKYQ